MVDMNKLKHNWVCFTNIFCIIFCALFVFNYLKYDVFIISRLHYPFPDFSLQLFSFPELIKAFFYKLIPFLFPEFNLNDVQNTIAAYFKTAVVLLTVFIITKVFFLFFDKKSFVQNKGFIPVYLIFFFLVFNNYNFLFSFMEISLYSTFFEWSMNLLLFYYAVYILYRIIFFKEKFTGFNKYFSVFVFFLLAISNEIYIIPSFIFILFISLSKNLKIFMKLNYKWILKIVNSLKQYQQLSIFDVMNKEKEDKSLYNTFVEFKSISVYLFVMTAGIILYYLFSKYSFGYSIMKYSLTMPQVISFFQFDDFQRIYSDFYSYFVEPNLVFIYIMLLSSFYIFIYKKKYRNVLFLPFLLFVIYYVFIFFIYDSYFIDEYEYEELAVIYTPIKYTFYSVLLFINSLLVGIVFKSIDYQSTDKFKNVFIVSICFFICLILYKYVSINYFKTYIDDIAFAKKLRILNYSADKISILSNKNTGVVVLPFLYYPYNMRFFHEINRFYNPELMKMIFTEFKNNSSRLFSYDDLDNLDKYTDNMYLLYLRKVYGIKPKALIYNTLAMIEYNLGSNGVGLTPNEKKRLKFSDLKAQKYSFEELNKLIEDKPSKFNFYLARANLYSELDKKKAALKNYDIAVSLDNKSCFSLYLRGLYYRNLNIYDKAAKDIQQVVAKYPNSLFLKENLAKYKFLNANYYQAFDIYSDLIKRTDYVFPNGAIVYPEKDYFYKRAELKENIDMQGAINDYILSSELNDMSYKYDVNYRIAFLQSKLSNDYIAINYYNQELIDSPERYELYYYRGVSYFNIKEYDLAVKDFIIYLDNIEEIDDEILDNVLHILECYSVLKNQKVKRSLIQKLFLHIVLFL